jgi:hypothetical protein
MTLLGHRGFARPGRNHTDLAARGDLTATQVTFADVPPCSSVHACHVPL